MTWAECWAVAGWLLTHEREEEGRDLAARLLGRTEPGWEAVTVALQWIVVDALPESEWQDGEFRLAGVQSGNPWVVWDNERPEGPAGQFGTVVTLDGSEVLLPRSNYSTVTVMGQPIGELLALAGRRFGAADSPDWFGPPGPR